MNNDVIRSAPPLTLKPALVRFFRLTLFTVLILTTGFISVSCIGKKRVESDQTATQMVAQDQDETQETVQDLDGDHEIIQDLDENHEIIQDLDETQGSVQDLDEDHEIIQDQDETQESVQDETQEIIQEVAQDQIKSQGNVVDTTTTGKNYSLMQTPDRNTSDPTLTTRHSRFTQNPYNEDFPLKILFLEDKDVVRPQFFPVLDSLANTIRNQDPNTFTLHFKGHTNETGSAKYNLGLSLRRANAVKNYVARRSGIPLDQLKTEYFGESKPEIPGSSPEALIANRRVLVTLRYLTLPVKIAPMRHLLGVTTDANWVILDDGSGGMLIQDIHYRNSLTPVHSPTGVFNDVAISPLKGRFFVTTGSDGLLRVWDTSTGRQIDSMGTIESAMRAVDINTKTQELVVSVGDKGRIVYWDLLKKHASRSYKGHEGDLYAVTFLFNSRFIATGGEDGKVRIWDTANGYMTREMDVTPATVTSLAAGPHDQLVAGDSEGRIHLWNIKPKEPPLTFTLLGHEGPVRDLDFSKDGFRLLSGGDDGAVRLWDIQRGLLLSTLDQGEEPVHSVLFHPKDSLVGFSADLKYGARMWDLGSKTLARHFSPDLSIADPTIVHSIPRVPSDQPSINPTPLEDASSNPKKGFSPNPGEVFNDPILGIPFVWVPKGCAFMGCSPLNLPCTTDNQPAHEVCLDGFWMSRDEIPNKMWWTIMGSSIPKPDRMDDPITELSWEEIQVFIAALNIRGKAWYRLPTEAEWEYACRAGGEDTPFASELESPSDRIRRLDGKPGTTIPPGRWGSGPNSFGLVDMQGNTWEWVSDIYDKVAYTKHARFDPVFLGDQAFRFIGARYTRTERGGSWDMGTEYRVKCDQRGHDLPHRRGRYLGIRLIRASR